MKVLIIGLGSIAKKHIKALKHIKPDIRFFALRSGKSTEQFQDVANISDISECPEVDFVIIANPTAFHADAIKQVAYLKKPILIEKPPFHTLEQIADCLAIVNKNNIITYTAFSLRFLDCLLYLKKNIDINKVQEVNVYCGSYLPSWRSDTDYKKNYSANALMGGGVHLDLIHELDYVLWIFGSPIEVRTTLRSNSKIEVNSVDYANYTLIYKTFVVNIVLNYYRRDPKRTCEILLDDDTWNVDLMKNTITGFTNNGLLFQSKQTGQDTYINQMEYFCKAVSDKTIPFNSLAESVETLKIALS